MQNTTMIPSDPGSIAPAAAAPTPVTVGQRQRRRRRGERGEGVISTAIAVLVIAFLGVGMWVGFDRVFDDAIADTGETIGQIGRDN
ncbi:MAG: hypothetical protein GX868_02420 [Actinobacteria bacterium]|nr:hypothetical protein [Actinomycetota bacterium]